MTDKLKAAIITIAEYVSGKPRNAHTAELYSFHTSADALLPVWRKVRDGYKESSGMSFMQYHAILNHAKELICDDNLPAACELIADIINQLKQK